MEYLVSMTTHVPDEVTLLSAHPNDPPPRPTSRAITANEFPCVTFTLAVPPGTAAPGWPWTPRRCRRTPATRRSCTRRIRQPEHGG
jgi:hypothetical protein